MKQQYEQPSPVSASARELLKQLEGSAIGEYRIVADCLPGSPDLALAADTPRTTQKIVFYEFMENVSPVSKGLRSKLRTAIRAGQLASPDSLQNQ